MIRKERKLQRLSGYDYSKNNYYFITVCTHKREHFFGEIKNGEMILNEAGKIVKNYWLWLETQYCFVVLDEFVIMPNHFHGILIIDSESGGNGRARSVHQEKESENYSGENKNIENQEISIKSLSQLVGAFKTLSSRDIHKLDNFDKSNIFKWHKSFHDRIIRNERELNNVRNYIKNNPLKWHLDIENSKEIINDEKNKVYYEKEIFSEII